MGYIYITFVGYIYITFVGYIYITFVGYIYITFVGYESVGLARASTTVLYKYTFLGVDIFIQNVLMCHLSVRIHFQSVSVILLNQCVDLGAGQSLDQNTYRYSVTGDG